MTRSIRSSSSRHRKMPRPPPANQSASSVPARAQELAQLPVVTHGAAAREEACALRRRAATALVAADENGSHPEAADRVLEGRAGAGRREQELARLAPHGRWCRQRAASWHLRTPPTTAEARRRTRRPVCHDLGDILSRGDGVPPDHERDGKLYAKALHRGRRSRPRLHRATAERCLRPKRYGIDSRMTSSTSASKERMAMLL